MHIYYMYLLGGGAKDEFYILHQSMFSFHIVEYLILLQPQNAAPEIMV